MSGPGYAQIPNALPHGFGSRYLTSRAGPSGCRLPERRSGDLSTVRWDLRLRSRARAATETASYTAKPVAARSRPPAGAKDRCLVGQKAENDDYELCSVRNR